MRTILEHAKEFMTTMDQHSRNHCIKDLTRKRAEDQDLLNTIEEHGVTSTVQDIVDSLKVDIAELDDVLRQLREASS